MLDGRLDDPLYHETDSITDFVQQEPFEGEPATDKTEVWVAYDDDAVYVGARLWESDPSKRVTSDMRRDTANLYNTDHFAVLLDTFYDRRNGHVFFANAQGGMSDAQVTSENASTDGNTIWETNSANFEGGWAIEFRIPFRSIRFQRLRWEYQPGSELFIVYSDGRTTLTRGIPDLQNRSFVVKITRLFQL